MKTRILSSIAILVLVLSIFAGCSEETNTSSESPDTSAVVEEEPITEIVSEDGEKFVPDLTSKGETDSSAADITSDKIVLHGKTYKFPMRVSELYDDGWELKAINFEDSFKPNVPTSTIGFNLVKDDVKISLARVLNDSDSEKELKDCLIISFSMDIDEFDTCDFVLPGGITEKSKAADVVRVMGDPNNTKLFKGHCYSLEKQLTYNEQNDSELCYSLGFKEDGAIDYVRISISE